MFRRTYYVDEILQSSHDLKIHREFLNGVFMRRKDIFITMNYHPKRIKEIYHSHVFPTQNLEVFFKSKILRFSTNITTYTLKLVHKMVFGVHMDLNIQTKTYLNYFMI